MKEFVSCDLELTNVLSECMDIESNQVDSVPFMAVFFRVML